MNKLLQISVKYLCITFSSFEPSMSQRSEISTSDATIRPKVNAWPKFRHVKFQVGNLSTRIISYIGSCQFRFTVFTVIAYFMLIFISVLDLNPLIHNSRSPSYLILHESLMFNLPILSSSPLYVAMLFSGHLDCHCFVGLLLLLLVLLISPFFAS